MLITDNAVISVLGGVPRDELVCGQVPPTVQGLSVPVWGNPPAACQNVSFFLSAESEGLLNGVPSLTPSGGLTFTLRRNAAGVARYDVVLSDSAGGVSDRQTLVIHVLPVNQRPVFTALAEVKIPVSCVDVGGRGLVREGEGVGVSMCCLGPCDWRTCLYCSVRAYFS